VLEIASQKLGEALLDERYGAGRTMYVRTTALATNLAVHFKLGRENSMAWVTTLDKGQVVPNAAVRVSDCRGSAVATGTTDASGIVTLSGISPAHPLSCNGPNDYDSSAYFVSARATLTDAGDKNAKPVEDLAFTWSDWQRGIEPWRFNVPTSLRARARPRRPHGVRPHAVARRRDGVDEAPDPHADQQGLRPARCAARHAGHHACGQRPALHAARWPGARPPPAA
jgi:hypothetical protein